LASGAISPAHPTGDGLAGLLAGGSNRGWLLGLLLVLATVLAYQPAWQGGFLWDDDFYLTQNRMLFEPGGLKQM
jgi:peptidoglycan/LPS O-acetylase OafA/YrhL